jgi:hypothetical protein
MAHEVDGDQHDQRDFDALGEVGGGVVRALDRPADDGRGGVAHEAEADGPAEAHGERERDDHRDGGDDVADGVQREQQATERRVDVAGREREADDADADGDVRGAEGGGASEHLRRDLQKM